MGRPKGATSHYGFLRPMTPDLARWMESQHERNVRRGKVGCIKHLADLLRASGCKTIGEGKAAYAAKNELDL